MNDEMRAAFEATWPFEPATKRDSDGEYFYPGPSYEWKIWQRAWEAALEWARKCDGPKQD